jgi:hypothetical protein
VTLGRVIARWLEVRSGSFASVLACLPHVRLQADLGKAGVAFDRANAATLIVTTRSNHPAHR